MKTKIGRYFHFEAAHQLNGEIYGKCQNPHGHRYELIVEVEGKINQFGWICDFDELDKMVGEYIISKLDHQDLNRHFAVPTAENIAMYVFETLDQRLDKGDYWISKVLLHETADSYAEIVRQ